MRLTNNPLSLASRADLQTVHDPDYRVAVQDFNDFIGKLSEKIIEIDETIPELPVKDVVSVIYPAKQNNNHSQRQVYRIYRGTDCMYIVVSLALT